MNIQIKKQSNALINEEELNNLSKEELISKIKALTAHNVQLKNVISKSEEEGSNLNKPKRGKPFDFSKCTFRRILLKFLYLGWDYQGFVTQEDTTNTIENKLFEALTKTCLIKSRQEANYHRCGRTDKGVSSYGQVISIDVRSKLTKENQKNLGQEIDYCTVLNRVLPSDIQCIGWSPIPDDFSARFDCKNRTYKYFFPKGNLDIGKMREASELLLGTHDFRNLCKMDVGNGVVQFVRNINKIKIELFRECSQNEEFDMYVVEIEGQAFLWHQIRCIMGILFLIGEKRESPDLITELLDVEKNSCKPDYNMASEIPLNLFDCQYENEEINWYYSKDSLSIVLDNMKKKLTFNFIKGTMLMCMVNDLESIIDKSSENAVNKSVIDFLLQGVKSKNYVLVMKRPKCDSLEDKIKRFTKRRRIAAKDCAE